MEECAEPVTEPLLDLLFIVLGYLSGSLPMGVIVARTTGARDSPNSRQRPNGRHERSSRDGRAPGGRRGGAGRP